MTEKINWLEQARKFYKSALNTTVKDDASRELELANFCLAMHRAEREEERVSGQVKWAAGEAMPPTEAEFLAQIKVGLEKLRETYKMAAPAPEKEVDWRGIWQKANAAFCRGGIHASENAVNVLRNYFGGKAPVVDRLTDEQAADAVADALEGWAGTVMMRDRIRDWFRENRGRL